MEKYKLGERVKVKAHKVIGKVQGVHPLIVETGKTTYIYEIKVDKRPVVITEYENQLAKV